MYLPENILKHFQYDISRQSKNSICQLITVLNFNFYNESWKKGL